MSSGNGEYIGCEISLASQLKVSRATLRQASELLVQEDILSKKKGRIGGYFAQRPNTSETARMANICLRGATMDIADLVRAATPLKVEIARLAARRSSPESLHQLEPVRKFECTRTTTYREFIDSERIFSRTLSDIGGNRVLGLLLEIVYDMAEKVLSTEKINNGLANWPSALKRDRTQLVDSIIDGNEALAALLAVRYFRATFELKVV